MKNEPVIDRFFLDTNIFIYSFDATSPAKRATARNLIAEGLSTNQGIISHQVIQEFVSVAHSKFRRSFDEEHLTIYLDEVLFTLWKAYPSREGYLDALQLMRRHKLSWRDALIASTAIATGCRVLYSEDLQHNLKISTLKVVNPFL